MRVSGGNTDPVYRGGRWGEHQDLPCDPAVAIFGRADRRGARPATRYPPEPQCRSPMASLLIENVRGNVVESRHQVSLAVVDHTGSLVATSGDPGLITFMRSAAKPFQSLPLVIDGVVERFGITTQEIALSCASHNSEERQVGLVRAWLQRIGCSESDLACGPHPALIRDYAIPGAADVAGVEIAQPSSIASNCSGKHAGMLALAKHHGWPTAGYHRADHPVQERIRRELAEWCGIALGGIAEGTDGCGVVSFAIPLESMARGMARLVAARSGPGSVIVNAMMTYPDLVAGHGRLCTALMQGYADRLVTKVGAEGVYVAGLLDRRLGVALKVEDGHPKAAMVAVMAVLQQLGLTPPPYECLPAAASLPIPNTRGEMVGVIRAAGQLAFI